MPLSRAFALALVPALAGCAYYATGAGYVEHRTSPLMLWSRPGPQAAAPAPDRKVSEQDCTAPIARPTANLKCR